jgi:hypothetical protein
MSTFKQFLLEIGDQFQTHQTYHQNQGNKSIDDIAKEFYEYMGGRFPDCPLGIAGASEVITGSGNCAWTARRFLSWSAKKSHENPQEHNTSKILFFPETEREASSHIVPVYNNIIIDYIKAFTSGKDYKLIPLSNSQNGIHTPEPIVAKNYPMYDKYIIGDSIQDINKYLKQIRNDPKARLNTFERPTSKPTNYEPWQLGK